MIAVVGVWERRLGHRSTRLYHAERDRIGAPDIEQLQKLVAEELKDDLFAVARPILVGIPGGKQ